MDNTLPLPNSCELLDDGATTAPRASRGGTRKVAVALFGGAVGGAIMASASNEAQHAVSTVANSLPAFDTSASQPSTASSGSSHGS